jgi:hypothetical protein
MSIASLTRYRAALALTASAPRAPLGTAPAGPSFEGETILSADFGRQAIIHAKIDSGAMRHSAGAVIFKPSAPDRPTQAVSVANRDAGRAPG